MLAITQRCIILVDSLFKQGFTGAVDLTNSYPSGAAALLEGNLSIQIHGFCKETMFLIEDIEKDVMLLVGRYSLEARMKNITVENLTHQAWLMYRVYKERGYGRPEEWEALFIRHGYLKQVTKTILEEQA